MENIFISGREEQVGSSCASCLQNNNNKFRKQHDFASAAATPDHHDSYDADLAKEMNELSVQEREQVFDEIHGVAQTHEETPEFVAQKLNELDVCLSQVAKQKRKAYDRALFFKPTIQHDDKFKLMFLRADHYDAQKAAKRLAKYYEDKLELFGEAKLVKDITLDDLTEEDRQVLETGWFIELPHKDQVGRPIWFFDLAKYDFDRPVSMMRTCWYMIMVSMKDETAQRKGVSDVAYAPGNLLKLEASFSKVMRLFKKGGDVLVNLPMRITSYHFCYDDVRMKFLLTAVRNCFGRQIRLRIRTHFGSDLEIQYSLTTFGIPCKVLIRKNDSDGEDMKQQLHHSYLQRRREVEAKEELDRMHFEKTVGTIFYPQPTDVLIGRGRPYQDFPGNQRFGSIIDSNLELYHKCSDRFGKTCLSMDIVKTVQEYGGRFIERTKSGAWKEIDDVVAREKTAIGFRSRVSKVSSPDAGLGTKTGRSSMTRDHMPLNQAKRLRYDPLVVQY